MSVFCLAAPTVATASLADGILVGWKAVPGAAKYRVYYKTTGSWMKLADTTEANYAWTGARYGTEYTFTVRAFSKTGMMGPYDEQGKTGIYFDVPELVSASNTTEGVKITWCAVPGAAQYRVFYKTTGSWQTLADTDGTEYVWETARSGVNYTFTVRCVSADASEDGRSYTSAFDADGVSVFCLAAPTVAVANAVNGVLVKWKAVPGAAKYRVYYKTTGSWMKLTDTTEASYTWTGAKNGTQYTFTVRAFSKAGMTGPYDEQGKTVLHFDAPKLGSASNTTEGVKITWGAVPGTAQYRVFYKSTGNWLKLADVAGTEYVWKTAKSGVDYTFTVRCLSADKRSYPSAYDADGVSVFCLATPRVETSSMANGVQVNWTSVPGAAKYRVYYKTTGNWMRLTDTTGTSYAWTGAGYGMEYTFTVRPFSKTGVTGPCDEQGKTGVYFDAPTLESVSNSGYGVQITWSAVPGAAQYRVFYRTTGGWQMLADTTGTEYVWTEAESGVGYTFTVRCVSADVSADKRSYTSTFDHTGMAIKYIAAPRLDWLNVAGQTFELSWSEVPGAVEYMVSYTTDDGTWNQIGSTEDTSYDVEGLSGGTAYYFAVQAVAADGTLSGYIESEQAVLYSNSPLVSYTRISPNQDPGRNHVIDTITIHCTAGQCSVETLGAIFAPTSKAASSNYGVGRDGRIGMYVEEKDCSWCSSNRENDNRAITIEVSSDAYEPYWVTPAAYAAMLDLVTDICVRNGIKELIWSDSKEDRVNHLNGCNMTCHRDYYPKSCPGTYLYSREGQIAEEVNARLAAMAG